MVNLRCKKAVREELKNLRLHFVILDMVAVDVMENITAEQHEHIRVALSRSGLELMDNKKTIIIEIIENSIIEMVRNRNELSRTNFPEYLSEKLDCDYSYLSGLFSEGRGTTIENFILYQKIERVKELIIYEELSFKEIAVKMHFGSVAHLSSQFKSATGLTLSHFKELISKRQILVEDVRGI